MQKFTYVGSPGYQVVLPTRVLSLNPGDVVELSDEEAATVGDDFTPAKTKATAADKPEGA